jgi:hypothetical protein
MLSSSGSRAPRSSSLNIFAVRLYFAIIWLERRPVRREIQLSVFPFAKATVTNVPRRSCTRMRRRSPVVLKSSGCSCSSPGPRSCTRRRAAQGGACASASATALQGESHEYREPCPVSRLRPLCTARGRVRRCGEERQRAHVPRSGLERQSGRDRPHHAERRHCVGSGRRRGRAAQLAELRFRLRPLAKWVSGCPTS